MLVLVAKVNKSGSESRVFDLDPEQIKAQKKLGFLVKEQVDGYRPGLYTTRQQFLNAPGHNF